MVRRPLRSFLAQNDRSDDGGREKDRDNFKGEKILSEKHLADRPHIAS
jgi:hypothetical protein